MSVVFTKILHHKIKLQWLILEFRSSQILLFLSRLV